MKRSSTQSFTMGRAQTWRKLRGCSECRRRTDRRLSPGRLVKESCRSAGAAKTCPARADVHDTSGTPRGPIATHWPARSVDAPAAIGVAGGHNRVWLKGAGLTKENGIGRVRHLRIGHPRVGNATDLIIPTRKEDGGAGGEHDPHQPILHRPCGGSGTERRRRAVAGASSRELRGTGRTDRAASGRNPLRPAHASPAAIRPDAPAAIAIVADGIRRVRRGGARLAVEVEGRSGRKRRTSHRGIDNRLGPTVGLWRRPGTGLTACRDRDHHRCHQSHGPIVRTARPGRNLPHEAALKVPHAA